MGSHSVDMVVAYGIDGHAISLFTARRAVGYTAAVTKAVMHGIVRGVINVIQNGGKFFSAFASAFVSSAFSVGRYTFGRAAVFARTAVMAMVGGFASVISGGKFLNGAVSAAFVHLFNSERGNFVKRARKRALHSLNIDKIIAGFEKMRNLPLAQRMMLLYKFFKNKSMFDFKQEGKIYEDYGNFVYGAVGSALDIPVAILYRAAGWAQIRAQTSNPEWGSPYSLSGSYGDEPKDQDMIECGIDYYRNYYGK